MNIETSGINVFLKCSGKNIKIGNRRLYFKNRKSNKLYCKNV